MYVLCKFVVYYPDPAITHHKNTIIYKFSGK